MTDPDQPAVPGPVYGEDVPYVKDITPSTRTQGWSGERQRRFLEAIADGDTVQNACGLVGLSTASAYAFRRRANGRAFDLGWKAADLLARERVAADLLVRAVDGQMIESTRPDGRIVSRLRYDNRLAVQMLNRLDRYADASERTAPGHAARLVAGDFDSYLALVERDGGPARAGLYMLARNADGDAAAAELEPVLALARADRLLRCGEAAGDVAVADLDPARRAGWTGEQWARAEAAGLVALAPAPAPEPEEVEPKRQPTSTSEHDPRLNARDVQAMEKLRRLGLSLDGEAEPIPQRDPPRDSPVWWDEDARGWRTNFPPPADFKGDENGEWSDDDYERALTPGEEAVADPKLRKAYGLVSLEEAEAERDEWFRAAGESANLKEIEATPASAASGSAAERPNPFDVEGEAALGAAGESADLKEIEATPASAAIWSAAPQQPNPSDVEGEAALALAGADDVDTDEQSSLTRQPCQLPLEDDSLSPGEAILALLGPGVAGKPAHSPSTRQPCQLVAARDPSGPIRTGAMHPFADSHVAGVRNVQEPQERTMADTGNDITVLNSLIKTLNDSIQGYQESAKDIGNQRFATMFQERAQERQSVLTQLQAEVARLGGDPADSGSLLGSAHHVFLNLKSTITGKDDSAVLAEVQRGEEYLRDKFDEAIADGGLSATARSAVEQAAQSVRRGADSVRQFNTAI